LDKGKQVYSHRITCMYAVNVPKESMPRLTH
jgi:hypothetical protein